MVVVEHEPPHLAVVPHVLLGEGDDAEVEPDADSVDALDEDDASADEGDAATQPVLADELERAAEPAAAEHERAAPGAPDG